MFTDYAFHNIGVPQSGPVRAGDRSGRFDGIGKLVTTDPNVSGSTASSEFSDHQDSTSPR